MPKYKYIISLSIINKRLISLFLMYYPVWLYTCKSTFPCDDWTSGCLLLPLCFKSVQEFTVTILCVSFKFLFTLIKVKGYIRAIKQQPNKVKLKNCLFKFGCSCNSHISKIALKFCATLTIIFLVNIFSENL